MASEEERDSFNIWMRHGKTLHSRPVVDWLWRTYIADIWQVKLSWVPHCHLRTHDVTTISSALAGANVKNITSDDRSHTDSLLVIKKKENNDGDGRNGSLVLICCLCRPSNNNKKTGERQRSSKMDARCQTNGEELGLIRTSGLNRLKIFFFADASPSFFCALENVLGMSSKTYWDFSYLISVLLFGFVHS